MLPDASNFTEELVFGVIKGFEVFFANAACGLKLPTLRKHIVWL
jgi:hypothetical protein